MGLRLRIAVAVFVALATASSAQAQQAGKDEARRFFNAGQKAFKQKRYVEAAKAFEEAFRLKPHPFPLINAGDAWEKSGDAALAARTFQRVIGLEQSGEQDRADATERLARLTPKLAIVELKGEATLRARVDQDEFVGGDRVYVEPGEHVVTLIDVDGAKQRKLDLTAGVSRTVELATLMPEIEGPERTETAPATVEPEEAAPTSDAGPRESGGVRAPTLVMFGLTAVAAGGAVYFGLAVNDSEKKYAEQPTREQYDRFNQNKLFTNIAIGVAGVSAGVGTYLLIKDLGRKVPADDPGKSREREKARARELPRVGVVPVRGGGFLVSAGSF
jgi:tetratricopeptide (TPR) repeat protein